MYLSAQQQPKHPRCIRQVLEKMVGMVLTEFFRVEVTGRYRQRLNLIGATGPHV